MKQTNTKGFAMILAGVVIALLAVGGFVAYNAGQNSASDVVLQDSDVEIVDHSDNFEGGNTVVPRSTANQPEQSVAATSYSELGFSIVLPQGVTAGIISQSEGGPYRYLIFSDGTSVSVTSSLDFDDQFGTFPFSSPTQNIGGNTFFVQNNMDGSFLYGLESNGKRYQIYQALGSEIDLATFSIL